MGLQGSSRGGMRHLGCSEGRGAGGGARGAAQQQRAHLVCPQPRRLALEVVRQLQHLRPRTVETGSHAQVGTLHQTAAANRGLACTRRWAAGRARPV